MLGILFPVGTLVQGAIADATSLRTVTAGSGVVLALVLSTVWFAGRRGRQDGDGGGDVGQAPVTLPGSQLLPQTTTTTRSPRSGT